MPHPWLSVRWMEAAYSSDLKPLERLVAAIYADHAGDKRTAWVTLNRLCSRSGLSRDAANRAVRQLVERRWLMSTGTAKPRQPVVYALVIPEGASTSAVPAASTGHGPEGASTSTPDDMTSTPHDTTSTPHDTTSTGDVLNPSSYPSTHPSSSSSRTFIASALGWEEDDDRLDLTDDYLRDNNVKKAAPWLKACDDSGDLARNFEDFVTSKTTASADPWNVAPTARIQEQERVWSILANLVGDERARELVTHEAAAMGYSDTYALAVLKSVLANLDRNQEQSA